MEMCGLPPKSKVGVFDGFTTVIRGWKWTDIRSANLSIAPGMKRWMKRLVLTHLLANCFFLDPSTATDDLCFASLLAGNRLQRKEKTWYFRPGLTIARSLGSVGELYKMIRTKFGNLPFLYTFHSFSSRVGHAVIIASYTEWKVWSFYEIQS